MRRTKAIGVVACAATLSLGLGMMVTGGAGASTPAKKAVASPLAMENAAVRSAYSALQASSHIKSKAARDKAVQAALKRLEATVKVESVNIKPSAAAQRDATSLATKRAEKSLTHPGSLALGRHMASAYATYGSGFTTSSNWSGYVDTNGNYNYVFGEWNVPAANCGPWYDFNFSQSSTWVGIDGWGSGTVEQLGTATGCIAGASTYYAWTEMYPQIEDPIFNGISPGDQMVAFVYSWGNNTQYELWEADLSQGWSYVRDASTSSPLTNSSAEWITERPSCWLPCNNLTNFGTTTFTSAYAMTPSTFGSISSFPNSAVDLYNNNTWDAEVGGLSNGGTSFTDWFEHS